MQSRVTISGNIVSELSEKIPSNIIALNELIKNAYDAGAPSVEVSLDSTKKKLIIKDTGEGMNKSDIDTLFHISNSNKIYGSLNKKYNRYVQGSKGLGFLSVFKFGHKVQWETKKDKGYRFSLDYDSLVGQYDISECVIELIEDDSIEKGTKIEISIDDYNMNSLLDYFKEEKNYKKILNAFDDDTFDINIKIDGIVYKSSSSIKLLDNAPDYRLYQVTYNNDDGKIKFLYNNFPIIEEKFFVDSTRYKLGLELVIFQLPPHGKNKIDRLYLNPKNDLTPLMYVNCNLFNNYDMFDPNIMKNIKTDLVLNQMIGKIEIISADKAINFNSDRSQFLQNELTDEIKTVLQEINKKIQTVGSQHKKYLKEFKILTSSELPEECDTYTDVEQFRKFICSDFAFRELVEIERHNNKIKFALWGKEVWATIQGKTKTDSKGENKTGNGKTIPAIIRLNVNDYMKIQIPSEQIDLFSYIASVRNSKGEDVDKSKVKVKIDNKEVNNILPSITSTKKLNIEYSFLDSQTGLVIKNIILEFVVRMSDFSSGKTKPHLIMIPAAQNYTLNYNPYINKIVEQINQLDLKSYKEIITCCLRSLFEISLDAISKSTKYSNFFGNEKDFSKKVSMVIKYIKSNPKYQSEIATAAMIDYHSLGNMLDESAYETGVSKAHLGAHKSMTYISEMDVDNLGNLIGLFLVLVNEMLNNSNIQ